MSAVQGKNLNNLKVKYLGYGVTHIYSCYFSFHHFGLHRIEFEDRISVVMSVGYSDNHCKINTIKMYQKN